MSSPSIPTARNYHPYSRSEVLRGATTTSRTQTPLSLSRWSSHGANDFRAATLHSNVSWPGFSSRRHAANDIDEEVEDNGSLDLEISDDGERSYTSSPPTFHTSIRPSSREQTLSTLSSPTPSNAPSLPESTESTTRQPSFPGNRNIIDDVPLSRSPSVAASCRGSPVPSASSTSTQSLRPCHWTGKAPSVEGQPSASGTSPAMNSRKLPDIPPHAPYRPGNRNPYSVTASFKIHPISTTNYSPQPNILPPIRPREEEQHAHAGLSPTLGRWRVGEQHQAVDASHGERRRPFPDDDSSVTSSTASSSTQSPYSQPSSIESPGPYTLPLEAPLRPIRDKKEWEKYTNCRFENGSKVYKCLWSKSNSDGEHTLICEYSGARHLIKRHVETTHLKYKDHACQYCSKKFPQQVSLQIHMRRHTGEKPLSCPFEGCDEHFSDPSRRYKHMRNEHGYKPTHAAKRHRSTKNYIEVTNTQFENMAPWNATDRDATL